MKIIKTDFLQCPKCKYFMGSNVYKVLDDKKICPNCKVELIKAV